MAIATTATLPPKLSQLTATVLYPDDPLELLAAEEAAEEAEEAAEEAPEDEAEDAREERLDEALEMTLEMLEDREDATLRTDD